jgi:molybdopterin/thiamine biosynthesis adenylyltransferase
MRPMSIDSPKSIESRGSAIPGALDRQQRIAGFDQDKLSASTMLLVGAGGLNGPVAVALARKGAGALKISDPDFVEASNLNRQRFFARDLHRNKALALVENLAPECTGNTRLIGYAASFEDAVSDRLDLDCHLAICGVDNNPARVAVSRYCREQGVPAIFAAVSAEADHGYVFVQESEGACLGCLFPDVADDSQFPCPGIPAVLDILQAVAALAVYAVDSCLMQRPRDWSYRSVHLDSRAGDSAYLVSVREGCRVNRRH